MALFPRPIQDRIIVRPDSPVAHTEGGLLLPPSAREKNMCVEVLASGPGYIDPKGKLVPNTVKPGDRVMFGAYAGVEIEVDGEKYQVMRQGDLAGVLVEVDE